MDKKTNKIFAIFWLIAGLVWGVAVFRHAMVRDDMVGMVIYIAAAIISFILSFAYYKNFVK